MGSEMCIRDSKYYDMDKAIDAAFDLVNAELGVDLRA